MAGVDEQPCGRPQEGVAVVVQQGAGGNEA